MAFNRRNEMDNMSNSDDENSNIIIYILAMNNYDKN